MAKKKVDEWGNPIIDFNVDTSYLTYKPVVIPEIKPIVFPEVKPIIFEPKPQIVESCLLTAKTKELEMARDRLYWSQLRSRQEGYGSSHYIKDQLWVENLEKEMDRLKYKKK